MIYHLLSSLIILNSQESQAQAEVSSADASWAQFFVELVSALIAVAGFVWHMINVYRYSKISWSPKFTIRNNHINISLNNKSGKSAKSTVFILPPEFITYNYNIYSIKYHFFAFKKSGHITHKKSLFNTKLNREFTRSLGGIIHIKGNNVIYSHISITNKEINDAFSYMSKNVNYLSCDHRIIVIPFLNFHNSMINPKEIYKFLIIDKNGIIH